MTAENAIQTLEKYFGENYNPAARSIMAGYFEGHSAEYITACCETLVRRCSRMYGKAPGIAEIEKHREEIRREEERALNAKRLPEPPPERMTDGEYEKLHEEMAKIFGLKKAGKQEAVKKRRPFFIPQGKALIAKKSGNGCEGCFFQGKACAGLIDCVVNGEPFIYGLEDRRQTAEYRPVN